MRALLTTLIVSAALTACTRSGAAELMETAKLEELQRNIPHARELYQKIVTDHPDSPEAREARDRLAALSEKPDS